MQGVRAGVNHSMHALAAGRRPPAAGRVPAAGARRMPACAVTGIRATHATGEPAVAVSGSTIDGPAGRAARMAGTKKPACAGFVVSHRGAQERTRTSTVLPAST